MEWKNTHGYMDGWIYESYAVHAVHQSATYVHEVTTWMK